MSDENSDLVSVVVPTYYRRECLSRTLESLTASDYSEEDLEVIVVRDPEDGEAEEEVESFGERHDGIDAISLEYEVDNVSHARNLGIRKSRGGIVGVVDDDVVMNPNTIRRAVSIIENNPDVAAVAFPAAFDPPTFADRLHAYRFAGAVVRGVNTVMPVAFFNRDILDEIGHYREDMGPPDTIHEDWELGSRIRRHGYEVVADGETLQRHLRGGESGTVGGDGFLRGLFSRVSSYARSYLNGRYETFLESIGVGPLSQKLEYVLYSLVPIVTVAMLLLNPYLSLVFLLSIGVVIAGYALIKEYYSRLRPLERIYLPVFLTAVRIFRTYLSILGLLKEKLTPGGDHDRQ